MARLRWGHALFFAGATVLSAVAAVRGNESSTGAPTELAAVDADVVINWNDVRQRIDGFGASSYANLEPDRVLANADLLFDKDRGIGLSLDRMGFPWDPDTGGRPYKDIEIAQAAQARGVRVWASVFSPPAQWKTNGSRTGGGHLLPQHYQDFATLLADTILDLRNRHGVNVSTVSLQNEPDFAAPWASCLYTSEEFHALVPIVHNTFAQRGVSTTIMLGEQSRWSFNLSDATMQDSRTAAMVSILAAHAYRVSGFEPPYRGRKPHWMTEISNSDDNIRDMANGLMYAEQIYDFMTRAEASAWHWWNLGTLLGARRLYTIGNYSKFVRPGWVRVTVTNSAIGDGVYITAFKNPATGEFAIVAVNKGSSQTKSIGLNGFNAASVTPWLTTSSIDLAPQSRISVSQGQFTAALPGASVTTFVGATGSGETPTPVPAAPTNVRIIR